MKYRAVYEREKDGRWTVEIPEVPGCHSYGRTIDQARERVREALGLYVAHAESADIEDDVRLPTNLRRRVAAVKKLRDKVAREEAEMVEAQVEIVTSLRKTTKLGHRDVGRLLGLSHQRVQQLERRTGSSERAQPASRVRRRA